MTPSPQARPPRPTRSERMRNGTSHRKRTQRGSGVASKASTRPKIPSVAAINPERGRQWLTLLADVAGYLLLADNSWSSTSAR